MILLDEVQIDEAWMYVHGCESSGKDEWMLRWMLLAFSKLGIERCFGCDGHGETRNEDGELVGQCLVCDSHGWVINRETL